MIHVYTDGSVLISHGGFRFCMPLCLVHVLGEVIRIVLVGTEMGQGLHTKIIQIAAQKFCIPDSMVEVVETATNVVANGQPTGAREDHQPQMTEASIFFSRISKKFMCIAVNIFIFETIRTTYLLVWCII